MSDACFGDSPEDLLQRWKRLDRRSRACTVAGLALIAASNVATVCSLEFPEPWSAIAIALAASAVAPCAAGYVLRLRANKALSEVGRALFARDGGGPEGRVDAQPAGRDIDMRAGKRSTWMHEPEWVHALEWVLIILVCAAGVYVVLDSFNSHIDHCREVVLEVLAEDGDGTADPVEGEDELGGGLR